MADPNENTDIVLIVDDVPQNLQVLGSMLEHAGFETAFASSGAEALRLAESMILHLILLDVMMPEMDGFEVCRRLKSMASTRDVPVIFLTARTETEAVIKGLTTGGVDYITKPFNERELLARVRTHIGLQRARQALAVANATKEKFMSIIAHDLRAPLATMITASEMSLDPDVKREDHLRLLAGLNRSAKHLYQLTETLLDWARLQHEQMQVSLTRLDVFAVASQEVELLADVAAAKTITITVDSRNPLYARADAAMTSTLLRNLLSNAIKFTRAGGSIDIKGHRADATIALSIVDTGVGMNARQLARIFDLGRVGSAGSTRGTADERGTGLGLIMCREFARKNGGDLTIESCERMGTTAIVTLPAMD